MNTWDTCKNCGGQRGLHHYETDQCPVGGVEAPIGKKQEWKTTTFELETDEIADLRELNAKLLDALKLAEEQLAQAWKAETANWAIQHRDMYSRPDLCCFLDQYGQPAYPLAVALTNVRAAIKQAKS